MKRIVVFLFLLFSCPLFGLDMLRDYIEEQTEYWGIREKVTAAELDQLTHLKRKAEQPGLTQEERTKAYTDLFQFAQKLRGFPVGRVPAAMATASWGPGQPLVPPVLPTAKPGQLGNFKKHGSGAIPMILIPDLGADWSVFDSFMQRNQSRFTFYAVTLPGFGGTNAPKRPDTLDYGAMHWWNNAAVALLDFIKKEKINRPLILGHQAGSYLAMKLALQHPEMFRGTIVLNGLLYASFPGLPQNAPLSERVKIVNSLTPVELFPYPSPDQYRAVLMQNAAWYCKEKKCHDWLSHLTAQARPATWWHYFAELLTTDLSAEIKTLKVPMLVLPSIHDRESPGFESSKTTLDQWNALDHSISSLPITVIQIQESRAYATADQPAKLDEAIRNWTNGSLK
jgi:pimeloyl-ACP methyl ester carboxylesterase